MARRCLYRGVRLRVRQLGVHDLLAWMSALRAREGTIEVASALLGFAPLGLGIAAFGALLIIPAAGGWREAVAWATFVAALVLSIAGILLGTVGSFGVTAVMRHHGYHVCHVWRGTRMSVTTWTARGRACANKDDDG